jgi:hypothetical protein
MEIKTTTICPEMCECGRLYKDRRDENGKMICSACFCDCDLDTLKMLSEPPIKRISDIEKNKDL